MKKIFALIPFILPFLTSSPAFAQDEFGDAAAGGTAIAIWCCIGIGALIGIALFIFWIFMLVDCIKRQDDQFPNPGPNTKTIWLVILIASLFVGSLWWLAAIIYYFMVKKKVPI